MSFALAGGLFNHVLAMKGYSEKGMLKKTSVVIAQWVRDSLTLKKIIKVLSSIPIRAVYGNKNKF